MMTRLCLVLVFILNFNGPALAALKGCYARTYDKAHLAAHPKQKVTFMTIQIGLDRAADASEEDDNILLLRMRGDTTKWLSGFACANVKDGTRCKIIDDKSPGSLGGRFLLVEKEGDVLLNAETDFHLTTEGEFLPVALDVVKNPEHKVFKLKKLSGGNCTVF